MSKKDPFTYARMFKCLRDIMTWADPDGGILSRLKGQEPVHPEAMATFVRQCFMDRYNLGEIVEFGGFGPLSAKYCSGQDAWITFYYGTKRPGEVVGAVRGPTFRLFATDMEESLVALASNALGIRLADEAAAAMDEQRAMKAKDRKRRAKAHVELDAMEHAVATGLQLQLPSTADLEPVDEAYPEDEDEANMVPPEPVAMWKPYPDHPGLTIPRDWQHPTRPFLKGWSHYPVVKEVKPVHAIKIGKRCYASVQICQQDGHWVAGKDFTIPDGGGGCAPGRKWGEHASALHAELYGWESVLQSINAHPESSRKHKEVVRLIEDVKLRIGELRIKVVRAHGRTEPFKEMKEPVATGLQLQLPSTADLPPGYAKAKDLQPGMVVLPPRRKDALIVKSVELYGKSCSIMFEGGHAGMNVNPLQPVQVVSMMEAASVPFTDELKPDEVAPKSMAEAVALVRSYEYILKCFRMVLLQKPKMAAKWHDLRGQVISERELRQLVTASWPKGTAIKVQLVEADGCAARCAGHHHPELMPALRWGSTLINGEWFRGDDLVDTVAVAMGVGLPHLKPVITHVAIDANPSPKTVAAVREVVAKAYTHKPRKRKVGHQAGLVLEDGTMVADPTRALEELHDLANGTPAPPQQAAPLRVDHVQSLPWPSQPERVVRTTIAQLAAPFGRDRREREVVKKRFTTLMGKLRKLPDDQLTAFLNYANTTLL